MGLFEHEYFPYTNLHELNLDYVLKSIEDCRKAGKDFLQWVEEHEPEYAYIKKIIEDMQAGLLPDGVANGIYEWMKKNGLDLIAQLATQVYFGLTDDGYFVAYVPESWDDIIFNTTGYDIDISLELNEDYGRLVLSMEVSNYGN